MLRFYYFLSIIKILYFFEIVFSEVLHSIKRIRYNREAAEARGLSAIPYIKIINNINGYLFRFGKQKFSKIKIKSKLIVVPIIPPYA